MSEKETATSWPWSILYQESKKGKNVEDTVKEQRSQRQGPTRQGGHQILASIQCLMKTISRWRYAELKGEGELPISEEYHRQLT